MIYFIFGYFPLGVRVFNILLSLTSTYFLFDIGKRQFGALTANIFLLIALFLPTQILYSITLSKDFLRVFVICLALWILYGGVAWLQKEKI
jgi:4-amino-4-deoxy-L-arabinose transferase-like glycosyltransferase